MFRIPPRVLAFTASAFLASGALASTAGAVTTTTPTTTTPTTPTTTTPTSTPTPKPKPKPKPVDARVSLSLPDAFLVSHHPVTIPGRTVHVAGVVRPFVPGQWVTVRCYLGSKLVKTDRLRLKPNGKHTYGAFSERVVSPGVGTITVKVAHDRNKLMLGFLKRSTYAVLDTHVGFGSSGPFVELMQNQLGNLHFFLGKTGIYDSGMGLAIDAYHRLLGWGTSQLLDGRTIAELLDQRGAFTVRFPSHGDHAEGDLTHQLLALIKGSKVYWIFPISSGKPSTPTVLGDFQVYRRTPGYLPDGMYFSSFFTGGYAIHGYNPAPDYPASHGCMRLPIQDAIAAYDWLTFGDWVDVYYH
jgi:L,D-transpeptidase catalytic domain